MDIKEHIEELNYIQRALDMGEVLDAKIVLRSLISRIENTSSTRSLNDPVKMPTSLTKQHDMTKIDDL